MKVTSLSCVRPSATPWTVAFQAPLSIGFSKQDCWTGFPFPSPGDLPHQGIEPWSSSLQADTLPSESPGNSKFLLLVYFMYQLNYISSVTQSCPTLCDPMNCSTPGLPVHHQLPEFTQIHIHRVSDDILPSHPLWSPSPPAPNPSQHQSLFQ